MAQEDDERMVAFKRAWMRGDVISMMRLAVEEWELFKKVWADSPLRHLVFGIVVAIVFRVVREISQGPFLLDVLGLIALVWYGSRTVFEILPAIWPKPIRALAILSGLLFALGTAFLTARLT